MRLGHFQHGWWKPALRAAGHATIELPVGHHPSGNAYEADLTSRMRNAQDVATRVSGESLDLLLDNGGTGLGFLPAEGGGDSLDLLHERLGLPLCSHLVDPATTALQGLDWPTAWQALLSGGWIKAVWDRAHAIELQRFGVPQVIHLPLAAPLREYPRDPLDLKNCRPVVSFVGGQNTTFFSANTGVATGRLLPGALVHGIQSDLRNVSFYDAYHDWFGLGEPACASDGLEAAVRKSMAYFNAKLFYSAGLCLRQRDRFVIFLQRKLGDLFRLIGSRWDETYGLACEPPFETADEYFHHFRETAINLNFVNGNAESGLNMRHFEITAAGGFLLCYDQPELADCFVEGKECAVFRSEKDLLEKIQYYLSHPDARSEIALAGQRRTLGEHLFSHRLDTLLKLVRPALGPPHSPSHGLHSAASSRLEPRAVARARAHGSENAPIEFTPGGCWEKDTAELVSAADVILDCGANVGYVAAAYRRLYPKAAIYCFEPVSSVFARLQQRCTEIQAHPIQKGVGDRDGRATIHLTASQEAHSLLDFQEGNPCARWTQEIGQEEIEICTLDRWCETAGIDPRRVDILKLDIQGAELQALYGARALLRTVRVVYLEVSFVPIYKDCPLFSDIDAFMSECGYRRHALYPSDQPAHWGDALYVNVRAPAVSR